MLSCVLKPVNFMVTQNAAKNFSTSNQKLFKVTVAGAAGGIGQPLCMLLKHNKLVTCLNCFDIVKMTPGVAVDLSHINTTCKVQGFVGTDKMTDAMNCADIVVIPAGVPRQPGMSRDDLFNTNASLIRDMSACIAQCSPQAIIAIITNPLNSMVPIACEVLDKAGVLDPNRVLGVTTLDLLRTSTFVGEINKVDPRCVNVPVIGGHSGVTIIPLLSQSQPVLQLTDRDKLVKLTKRIQNAGTEVVKAKAGGGSATLSMAYAAARLTNAVMRGLCGESNVIECAYLKTTILPDVKYFACPLLFGTGGVEKVLGYGGLSDLEQQLLKNAIPELKKNIKKGEDFVNGTGSSKPTGTKKGSLCVSQQSK